MNDQHLMIGRFLTATDPHPPVGTQVVDALGSPWINDGCYPCCWVHPYLIHAGVETWTKVAGNYGPVVVTKWGDEDDEYDQWCRETYLRSFQSPGTMTHKPNDAE